MWSIQQVLNAKVLGFENRQHPEWGSLLQQNDAGSPVKTLFDWFHYFDGNADQIDPKEAEQKFKSGGILEQDEDVKLAFRIGNDFHMWTNMRFLLVDRKGFFGEGKKK